MDLAKVNKRKEDSSSLLSYAGIIQIRSKGLKNWTFFSQPARRAPLVVKIKYVIGFIIAFVKIDVK